MLKFAENLKYLRELKDMNQSQMAADIGFSFQKWNNYERNTSRPGWDDLIKISKYFGVLESDLMHRHLSKCDLNVIYGRYKNQSNYDLKDGDHDVNGKDTPGSHFVNEPKTGYDANHAGDKKMQLLLSQKDETIQALQGEINALQSALSFAETTINLLKERKK